MRIQHNIPAMSSYRNYTNNVSALQKNLEKLSSGYKINRAGDDAAGLAISEKMRAQISGLEQAQANAKSGINLVQTAEGALTEVHDMLNRMVTLAEQSANGTYDNEVDRVQLQKEVNQLRDEIDRIADSSNFNGIKLLDGSLDDSIMDSQTLKLGSLSNVTADMILPGVEKQIAANTTSSTGGTSAANGATEAAEKKQPVATRLALNLSDLDITYKDIGTTSADKIRFAINFGRKTRVDAAGDGTQKDIVVGFTFNKSDVINAGVFDENGKLNVSKLSKLLADDIGAGSDDEGYAELRLDIAGVAGTDESTYSGFDIKVDENTNQILFKLHDVSKAQDAELNLDWNKVSNGIRFDLYEKDTTASTSTVVASDNEHVTVDESSRVNGWKDGMKDPTGIIGTNTIVYNDVGEPSKTNFYVNLEDLEWKVTKDQLTDKSYMFRIDFGTMIPNLNNDPTKPTKSTPAILGFSFDKAAVEGMLVDTDNDGKEDTLSVEKLLEAIENDADYKALVDDTGFANVRADVAGVCDATKPNGGYSGFGVKVEGEGLRFELHDLSMAHPDEANANWGNIGISILGCEDKAAAAATTTDYNKVLAGGDGDHGWSVGTSDMHQGVLPGQNTFANTVLDIADTGFDVNNAANNDGYTITADGKTFVLAVGDSDVAKADLGDTNAIVVKVSKSASVDKQLEELANAMNKACKTWEVGATATHSKAGYGLSFRQREDGAKATDMAGHDLTTVDGIAESFSFGKVNVNSVTAGKKLTLQIGDTAEDFNKLAVSVKDMHTTAMGIGDIDISSQEGASKAMDAIKNAINYVSDVRGTLGATQNRLDHTINNLTVMQENIQDAESTIRDVDVAKEMMEYTKNNILVQSAQAMLAQANQLPQGVLQLLG